MMNVPEIQPPHKPQKAVMLNWAFSRAHFFRIIMGPSFLETRHMVLTTGQEAMWMVGLHMRIVALRTLFITFSGLLPLDMRKCTERRSPECSVNISLKGRGRSSTPLHP